MTKKFNLCDEGWIPVRSQNEVSEVSLKDALLNAHLYQEIAGEIAGQDIALMRLLLAVLHTVFSRVDADGNPAPICDREDAKTDEAKEEAFERWKTIWKMGKFPAKPIEDYLNIWHERFYLFHPEHPFYQLAELDRGTSYSAAKLNGEISESANKLKLFSKFSGNGKETLSFAQAARWLPYLIAFDDTSSKPTKEGKSGGSLPSPGAGWLGKLGLTALKGKNLFETLALNLVMINGDRVECDEHPIWEADKAPRGERVEIKMPDNLAALYTIQSRRLLLDADGDRVTGCKLIGGDFFPKENAFIEPMTIWRAPKKENDKAYVPKRHNITKQLWREFSTFYPEDKESTPGVVKWYRRHVSAVLPRSAVMTTYIACVSYGDKDFFVDNAYSDSLSFSSQIVMEDLGKAWRGKINKAIEKCESVAQEVYRFGNNINIACGGDEEKRTVGAELQEQFYYRLDIPFRKWLASIDPENENHNVEKPNELKETVKSIVRAIADGAARTCGPAAFAGRIVGAGDGSNKRYYSVPKAINALMAGVNKIYEYKEEKNDKE